MAEPTNTPRLRYLYKYLLRVIVFGNSSKEGAETTVGAIDEMIVLLKQLRKEVSDRWMLPDEGENDA